MLTNMASPNCWISCTVLNIPHSTTQTLPKVNLSSRIYRVSGVPILWGWDKLSVEGLIWKPDKTKPKNSDQPAKAVAVGVVIEAVRLDKLMEKILGNNLFSVAWFSEMTVGTYVLYDVGVSSIIIIWCHPISFFASVMGEWLDCSTLSQKVLGSKPISGENLSAVCYSRQNESQGVVTSRGMNSFTLLNYLFIYPFVLFTYTNTLRRLSVFV